MNGSNFCRVIPAKRMNEPLVKKQLSRKFIAIICKIKGNKLKFTETRFLKMFNFFFTGISW